MGLPTNFSTFHKLLDSKDEKINKAFGQFKLTAIVLCDPNDSDFYAEMKRSFAALDGKTGVDLLFIVFTDGVGYEKIIPEGYTPILFQNDCELQERLRGLNYNQTLTKHEMLRLAQKYHIPAKNLPAIIITNDLCSRKGLVLRTTKEDFGEQLVMLSYYAATHDGPISLDEIHLGLFRARSREEHYRHFIARELEDLFCITQLRQAPHDTIAQRYCSNRLRNIISKLNHLNSNEDLLDEVDEIMDDYSSFRLAGHNDAEIGDCDKYYIDKQKLNGAEEDTLNTLESYNRILTLADDNHPFDYLYLANGIGRMFETEVNLSVVQQMRKTMSIPMPSYFNRFYSTEQEFSITTKNRKTGEERHVNLNMWDKNYDKYDEVWRAPNLGDSLAAYRQMSRDKASLNKYDNLCKLEESFVYNYWYAIAQDRNKGSHTSVSSEESKGRFEDSYSHFKAFLDSNYFDQLMKIKKELKKSNA